MNNRGRIACCGAISQYDGVPSAHGPRGVPGLIVVKRLIMQGFIVMDSWTSATRHCRPAVLGRRRQVEGAGGRHRRPREHAEGADRIIGRREPRQADDQGVTRGSPKPAEALRRRSAEAPVGALASRGCGNRTGKSGINPSSDILTRATRLTPSGAGLNLAVQIRSDDSAPTWSLVPRGTPGIMQSALLL